MLPLWCTRQALFLPLGEFIRKVGPSPPDVALVTYLQRLKEQGWNVDRTERKMIMCGVTTTANATAADGLQDMLAGMALAFSPTASIKHVLTAASLLLWWTAMWHSPAAGWH